MVIIRTAGPDDYPGLIAVIQAVDNLHADAVPRVFRRIEGTARSVEWFADALNTPDSLLLVAVDGDAVVGFLAALVRQSPEMPMFVPRCWMVVDGVYVADAYRGQGVGRALMEQAQAWALAQGLAEVDLNVWEFNQDVVGLYEALGYTTITRRMWKALR